MFHLLPIRILLTAIVALVGSLVVAAVYAGLVAKGDPAHDIVQIIRWSSSLSVFLDCCAPSCLAMASFATAIHISLSWWKMARTAQI